MQSAAPLNSQVVCACGSGLKVDRCCALDWTASWPTSEPASEVDPARAALQAGNATEAERLLVAILERSPLHVGALALLQDMCAAQGRGSASEALLVRVVRIGPDNLAATQALALALFGRRALAEAEVHAAQRRASCAARSSVAQFNGHDHDGGQSSACRGISLPARDASSCPHQSAILFANLAWNLKNQGRMEESRKFYEQSVALDPDVFQTLYGWAQMEETDRNFARAGELLDAAQKLSPDNPQIELERAILYGRMKDHDRAVATLDAIERRRGGRGLGPIEWTQKGLFLTKWGAFRKLSPRSSRVSARCAKSLGMAYRADEAEALIKRLKSFFAAGRLEILPRAGLRADVPQPIFIVGFPRSGTTMIEQTLTAHPLIAAGDELPIINELTGLIPRLLSNPLAYPEALSELWLGDQAEGLDNLRDYYLQRARQLGAMREGASLVHGQDAPQRDASRPYRPDLPASAGRSCPPPSARCRAVCILQSSDARLLLRLRSDDVARHYVLVADLVEHYLRGMKPRYFQGALRRRYRGPRGTHPRDSGIHRRAVRSALPALPRKPALRAHGELRASDRETLRPLALRYRDYRRELDPVVPILEPTVRRLGYAID